ncbi:MAG: hypothetical protein QY328_00765 [Anaerolineales bacterium]|nr:MAG: hypothetical protein QY328_00765 [Anaerolineales bacterium]
MKNFSLLLLLIVLISLHPSTVLAQSPPSCSFQPDGSIICTTGGGNDGDDDDGGGGNDNDGGVCTPGSHMAWRVTAYDEASSTCTAFPIRVDNCTGQILHVWEQPATIPCSLQEPTNPPQHPCTTFSVGPGGITCTNSSWNVSARVTFPEIYLDVRPYPATLVRWQTFIRNGGLPESSDSGGVNYIANGGGSPIHPQVGDWRNLRLILTLRPAGPMFVTLSHIGDLMLPAGAMQSIQWDVPSHPTVGAGTLAGSVSGLDELPGDMPLFAGYGRAPYKLYWELRYQEYEAIEGCLPGPNGNGNYNCGGGTGHRGITGYEWRSFSSGGEIPPMAVADLPAALMADLNNDGTPDAFWDNNLTLRRMDEGGSISNPQYQRSWNWGGIIYWAVREGQGQIGWPGR